MPNLCHNAMPSPSEPKTRAKRRLPTSCGTLASAPYSSPESWPTHRLHARAGRPKNGFCRGKTLNSGDLSPTCLGLTSAVSTLLPGSQSASQFGLVGP